MGSLAVIIIYDGYAGYTRTGEAALSFGYNGLDDRVRQIRGSATLRYVFDGDGRVMGEYGATAADVKAEYIWLSPEVANDNIWGGGDGVGGYAPLAVSSAPVGGTATLSWIHANHIGAPILTTNASGTAITPSGYTQIAFPGQLRTLPDLYYNRYRDYDPTTGRYVQADPIGLAGDANPYAYAMNNPLRYSDPLGLEKLIGFERGSGLERAARNDPDVPGRFTFYGHGNRESSRVGTRENWKGPEEFLNYIKRNGWNGQPIWLNSCQSGRPGGFADQLADLARVPVYASPQNIRYFIDGSHPRVDGPRHKQRPRSSDRAPGIYRRSNPK